MWLDIVLGIIIGGAILLGAIKGGIRQIFGILGIILGVIGASNFYIKVARFIPIVEWRVAKTIGFIILFFVIALIIYLIGFLIYKLFHIMRVGFLDRALGIILGGIKGTLLAGIICFFITLFPNGNNIARTSRIAPIVVKELQILRTLFPKEFQKRLKWHTPREATFFA